MASVQLVVAVLETSDRLATGSSPVWNCAWSRIILAVEAVAAVDRARHAHAATVDGDDRVGLAARRRPPRDSQTGSCVDDGRSEPVVKTSGPGVGRGLVRAGADHADAHGAGPAVDRVQVGVVVGAIQLDARRRAGRRRRRTPATCSRATTGRSWARRSAAVRWAVAWRWPRLAGRAPELVAKRGSAARPGTQPASTVGRRNQDRGGRDVPTHADHSSRVRLRP